MVVVDEVIAHWTERQQRGTTNAHADCLLHNGGDNATKPLYNSTTDTWSCPPYFDEITCWPETLANTTRVIQCPDYMYIPYRFNSSYTATKQCLPDGEWFPWSNYTSCVHGYNHTPTLHDLKALVPTIKLIARTGYTISFFTLVCAFFIMFSIKKLHCARNKLHMHLFASFILRAAMTLLKDLLFIDGLGFNSDTRIDGGQTYFVNDKNGNWGCKLFMSLFNFFITANYSWILMEGLYLYNLIFRAMFADSNTKITQYIVLGWGTPLLVISAWATVRVLIADTLCWTTHEDPPWTLWVIRFPTAISILINMFLFVRIAVVIYSKLQAPAQEDARSYRKWARSTLVLAPLFGIHYALLIGMSMAINKNETVETIWLFADQLFASSQGFVVAILYCFLNSEVRTELKPHAHAFLLYIASHNCLKYCFPCRERYLRSSRGRTSVCTTMSCSSLFNNGVNHHRNSRTGSRGDFAARNKNDRNKEHVCHPHARYIQDDSQARHPRGAARQLITNGSNHQNERLSSLNEDFTSESFCMLPQQKDKQEHLDIAMQD